MNANTDKQTILASEDQAIGHGQTLGMSAWESFLPHEMFEDVLRITTGAWRDFGVEPAWIAAGERAARAAFRGS